MVKEDGMYGLGSEGSRERSFARRLRDFWLDQIELAGVGMRDPENTWWNGSGYAGWARHAQPVIRQVTLGEPPSSKRVPFDAGTPATAGNDALAGGMALSETTRPDVADLVRDLGMEADVWAKMDQVDDIRGSIYTSFLYEAGAPAYCDDWGLGEPGAYRKVGDVYRRDFTRGMTLANVGSTPRTITLDEPHQTLDGKTVTSVTIRPQSAELLRRLAADSVHLPPAWGASAQTQRQKAPKETPKTRKQR